MSRVAKMASVNPDSLRLFGALLLVTLSVAAPRWADAAPSISSAANQTFTVGDPATLISTITITDDAVTRTIRKKNDIRIRIPSTFDMTWDTSITTVTLGGPDAGNVSTTLLAYEDGDRTMVLDVTKDFQAGEQFTIADPQFTSFSAPSTADNLELEVLNDDVISDIDDKTITITAGPGPAISSAANQIFTTTNPPTLSSIITITDGAVTPTITSGNDIRIRIPATFNMTWDPGITTVTIGGSAAGKVSATLLPYEDGDRTMVLDVFSDFAGSDQITVSGPQFTNFSAPSTADNLELEVNNDNVVSATDAKTIIINVGAAPDISSAANQTFTAGDPATLISTITITDNAVTRTITKNNDIRIRIPSTFNMTWDTSITTVTLGGPDAGKVSTTLLAYEDGDQTMVLDVTNDFQAGDQFTIADPQFTSFSAPSATDNLELEVLDDDVVSATDDKTIKINIGVALSMSSAADQSFKVGDPATPGSTITITDDAVTPTITGANDIRIRIPATFNMTWDPGITTVTLGGPAAGKVSGTLLAYEDGNRTMVLNVTSDFAGGDQITVTDQQFMSFSAPSAIDNLELEVLNDNVVSATDGNTITINADASASISSAVNQSFTVGDPATLMSTITITDNAVTRTIRKNNDIRIRIPSTFNMTWDTSITTVTLGGPDAGKVSATLLPYEDGDRTIVLDVTNDFQAGDQITIAAAQFDNFSIPSAADNLELEVLDDDVVSDTDDKTISITPAVPALLVMKASLTIEDPYNGVTNPKSIPAATVRYLVSVTNSGSGPVDADTLAISDPIPANAAIRVVDYSGGNPGPVAFVDGATSSGLSYTFTSLASTTDDVEFSNNNQATWSYAPADVGDGTDPAVTDIRIKPSGSMAASLGGGDPSFQVLFKVVVQ